MRAYQKPDRPPCSVAECGRPLYARGMCVMHYSRVASGRGVGPAHPVKRQSGEGGIDAYGYRVVRAPGHPLARAQDKIKEHRRVLYDAIGDGAHPCHWCGITLTWDGSAKDRINVDHLDFDRLHNALANLVVSCLDCNTKRMAGPRKPPKPRAPKTAEQLELAREKDRDRARAYYQANRARILARMAEKRGAA